MEITREEYNDATRLYWKLVNSLPVELQEQFPPFDRWLSPADVSFWNNPNTIALTITGQQRWELLHGPNARTLLAAYAAQRLG